MTRSFDVFYDLHLIETLNKQSWDWWFETPSRPSWRHCNDIFFGEDMNLKWHTWLKKVLESGNKYHFQQLSFCYWLQVHTINKTARVHTPFYYSDVIMGTMASEIISLMIVYSTIYSGADQRKHQSSAPLAFVRGIHRWPVNSLHKGPVKRKLFFIWWRHHVILMHISVFNFP